MENELRACKKMNAIKFSGGDPHLSQNIDVILYGKKMPKSKAGLFGMAKRFQKPVKRDKNQDKRILGRG